MKYNLERTHYEPSDGDWYTATYMIEVSDGKNTVCEGIYSTCINEHTIDESPMAYKPIESIIENIKDTVDIIKQIKPIYNFKAED